MEEKKGLSINVGASSIILILLVLSLSVFAVLSIKASNNEYKLAMKTARSVQEYYEADARALGLLGEEGAMDGTIFYEVPVNENAVIQVSAAVDLDGSYTIHKWKLVNSTGNLEDYGLNEEGITIDGDIWDGQIPKQEEE